MPDTIRVITLAKQGPAGPAGAPGGVGQFATVTDPAVDAAVTTAIVDANDGVVMTFTTAANAQTIQPPTDTSPGKAFAVVNDDSSGFTGSVNGLPIAPGILLDFRWDGDFWATVDAGAVASVNGQTGVVVLDADAISDVSTTNKFTTATEITKLSGIEDLAEVNPTPVEIKTDYESNADTNAFTDDEQSKLDTLFMNRTLPITTSTDPAVDAAVTTLIIDENSGVVITTTTTGNSQTLQPPTDTPLERFFMVANDDTSTDSVPVNGRDLPPGFFTEFFWDGDAWIDLIAPVRSVNSKTGAVVLDPDDLSDTATTNKFTTAGDITKLAGIEAGAQVNPSDAEIKTAYENNADTNAFTDAEQTKLGGIESGATADQTDSEIKTAYENNSDTNAFTDADETKLDSLGTTFIETAVNLLTAGQNRIGVTDTSAARTITISTADITNIDTIGRIITIKDQSGAAGTNNILIDTEGSETIDGLTDVSIEVDLGSIFLYSNGTNLFILV